MMTFCKRRHRITPTKSTKVVICSYDVFVLGKPQTLLNRRKFKMGVMGLCFVCCFYNASCRHNISCLFLFNYLHHRLNRVDYFSRYPHPHNLALFQFGLFWMERTNCFKFSNAPHFLTFGE